MRYAVQLYFDGALESALREVRNGLTAAGVTPTLDRRGDRPHVSLAVLSELDPVRCLPVLERVARAQPALPVSFAAFDHFPTGQGVVYLDPTPSAALLALHDTVHSGLLRIGARVHEYYVPGAWVPHATVAFEVPAGEVTVAMSWLQANLKPMTGTFSHVGLIEVLPVRELGTFELGRA